MPKLRHYDHLGTARLVTFTCFLRRRHLSSPPARMAFIAELSRLRTEHAVRILGWVLMPEHVHLVLHPPDDAILGPLIGKMKARSARTIIASYGDRVSVPRRSDGSRAIWQKRFHDYNCRSQDEVRQKIEYCHKNPVRRGLVSEPGEWLWSSYNRYARQGKVVMEIDGMEA